jgi:hypothetical protein
MMLAGQRLDFLKRQQAVLKLRLVHSISYNLDFPIEIVCTPMKYDCYGVQGIHESTDFSVSFWFVDDLCESFTINSDKLIHLSDVHNFLHKFHMDIPCLPKPTTEIVVLNDLDSLETSLITITGEQHKTVDTLRYIQQCITSHQNIEDTENTDIQYGYNETIVSLFHDHAANHFFLLEE